MSILLVRRRLASVFAFRPGRGQFMWVFLKLSRQETRNFDRADAMTSDKLAVKLQLVGFDGMLRW